MNWEFFRLEKMPEVAETTVTPIELATMVEFPFVSIFEDVLVLFPYLSSVDVVAGDLDSAVLLWRSKMVEECHKYLLDECHKYLLEGCRKYFFSDS